MILGMRASNLQEFWESLRHGARRNRTSIEAALIALFYFLLLAPQHQTARLYLFMERDLLRSQAVAQGSLILFGPESTGGGNLPGGLFYWIMAIGQLVRPGLESAWILIVAAFSLTLALAYTYLARIADRFVALLAALFLFEARFNKSTIMTFLNVSFLPLFCLLAIRGLTDAFSADQEKTRRRGFALAGASIAMGIQFHYSIIMLAGIAAILALFARKLRLQIPGRSELLAFLVFFLLPILPYLLWKAAIWAGHPFGVQPSSAVGTIDGSLPSLGWQLKDNLEHTSAMEWIRILVNKLSYFIPLALGASVLLPLVGIKAHGAELRALLERRWSESWFRVVCAITALSAVPALYFLLVPIGVRYGLPFAAGCSILTATLAGDLLRSTRSIKAYAWLNIAISSAVIALSSLLLWKLPGISLLRWTLSPFAIVLVIAVSLQLKKSVMAGPGTKLLAAASLILSLAATGLNTSGSAFRAPTIQQLGAIGRLIASETGWKLEEARHRVYFVNHHKEQGFRLTYPAGSERLGSPIQNPGERPDGYIVIIASGPIAGTGAFVRRIEELPVPRPLKEGLRSDALRILRIRQISGATVASYRVMDLQRMPPYFHNIGYPYEPAYKGQYFDKLREAEGIVATGPDSKLYYWNDHPSRNPLFAAGVQVTRRQVAPTRWAVEAEVLGESLSQPSEWLSAAWTQAWQEPYIETTCEGRTQRLSIADSIGFDMALGERDFGMNIANYAFLAPFVRKFEIDCPQAPVISAVGHAGSKVTDLKTGYTLGPRRLQSRP